MCGDEFEVSAAPPAEGRPPPMTESEPGPSAAPPKDADPDRARETARWAWTKRGLGFHYARIVVIILSFLAYLFALVLQSVHATPVAAVLLCSSFGVSLVGPALGLIGSLLCLRVPSQAGARPFIILSLMLDVIVIPSTSLQYTGVLTAAAEAVGLSTPLLALIVFGALQMADWVFYIFFQRRLAQFFDDDNAADEAVQVLVRGVLLVVAPVLLVFGFIVLLVQVPLVGCLMLPLAYLLLIFLAALYVKFLLRQLALIDTLRGLIRNAGF
jgi:hypothetical protein